MKRTLIIMLAAVMLSASNLAAQGNNPKTTYIIDGNKVENFDGSQLVGKRIISYVVDSNNTHTIATVSSNNLGNANKIASGNIADLDSDLKSSAEKLNESQAVYVVDDVVYKFKDFMKLNPSDIKSMTIVKNKDSEIYRKFAKNGESSVIVVSTK